MIVDDFYTQAAQVGREHEAKRNMPPGPAAVFLALLDDGSWTWSGLAQLLAYRMPNDVDEVIACLQSELERKR